MADDADRRQAKKSLTLDCTPECNFWKEPEQCKLA
jgi:hypothetical protein